MDEFISFLTSIGLEEPDPVIDGNIHRCRTADKGGNKKNGWYIAHEIKGHIYGSAGNWGTGQKEKYTNGGSVADPEVLKAFRLQTQIRKKEQEQQWKRQEKKATEYCKSLFPADSHPYLDAKQIDPCGALQDGDLLVIPMMTPDGRTTSYQTIDSEGNKKYLFGGKKQGSAFVFQGSKERIYICEGYATGATIHMATGCAVFCAFDTSNLKPVVEEVKKLYQNIVVAADNDHETEGNPGVTKAKEAYDQVIYPVGIKGTDFNDMAVECGLDEVSRLLNSYKKKLYSVKTLKEILNTDYPPINWAVEGIIPEGLTILAGRPKLGKSWLLLGLAYAIAEGGTAWGYKDVDKGTVYTLFLEDSERRLKDRALAMEGYLDAEKISDNLKVLTDFPRIGEGGLESIEDILDNDPNTKMIVIDTIQKIRPKSKGKRNLYQAEYEDYENLQRLAIKRGIAIVCIHHTRKGSANNVANPFDEMSGSSGIQGVADTLIVCTRDGKKGMMHVTGREVEEKDYPMEFVKRTMTWQMSDPEDTQLSVGPMMLNEWFKTNTEITVDEAADVFEMNIRQVQRKLKQLVEDGKLVVLRKEGRKNVYGQTEIFE